MIELTVRLVASLAIVVGLLLVTVRIGARKFRPRAGAPLRILHRQALSRSSSVAVIEVGNRTLVIGHTEHQISILAELGAGDLSGDLSGDSEQDDLSGDSEQDDLSDDSGQGEVIDMEAARQSGQAFTPEEITATVARETSPVAANGPLAGSVLSAHTWRQALAVAKRRA